MKKVFNFILVLPLFLNIVKAQTSTLTTPTSQGVIMMLEDEGNTRLRPDFLPRLINKVDAKYTDKALEKAISGKVILKAIINTEGKITDVQIIQGLSDGLTETAIHAAQKTRFEPALKGSKPVESRVKLAYAFYCSGLEAKRIKAILRKENPWFSENAAVLLTNQLYLISGINYYEVIQFAPELIKHGIDLLSPTERREYAELQTQLKPLLSNSEQDILQQFPLLSGKEIAVADRQKSNAVLRKAWDQLSSQQQRRWQELHNQVVEFGLFRRRVTKSMNPQK